MIKAAYFKLQVSDGHKMVACDANFASVDIKENWILRNLATPFE